ncbi:MAG: hypothetical protein ACPG7F_00210 [Aggregatilineales bacterium]
MTSITNGFAPPVQNWTKLPHTLIGLLPQIKSISELKVILYVFRHTWGFQEFGIAKTITHDEIKNGRKKSDGTRWDEGTGLSQNAIKEGVKRAIEHGILTMIIDNSDKARVKHSYMPAMASAAENARVSEVDTQKSGVSNKSGESVIQSIKVCGSEYQSLTRRVSKVDTRTEKETKKETKKEKNTIAPVPGAIPLADMDDVPESVQHESSEENPDIAKNAILGSVEENEITTLPKRQKEKSSAKKEKSPSEKQQYTTLVKTGLCFPEHEYSKPGKLAKWFRNDGNYEVPIDDPLSLEDMVKFSQWMQSELADRESKYLPRSHARLQEYVTRWREWLSANPNTAPLRKMTVSERIDPNAPHYQPPPGSKPLTEEQKQAFKNMLKKPHEKKGGDAA